MSRDDPADKPDPREIEERRAARQAAQLTELSEMGVALARRYAEQARLPGATLDDVVAAANGFADAAESVLRNIALAHRLEEPARLRAETERQRAEARARRRAESQARGSAIIEAYVRAQFEQAREAQRLAALQTPRSETTVKSLRELAEDIRARRAARRYALGLPKPKPPTVH
jgi:hypothetical protein